ncbi:hypothetical protein HDV06_001412 [Boothiomyces sp. JEL0866]|nr:hypothetical protein HDV06_001412 [Boothiomyces sp. JEL0866]
MFLLLLQPIFAQFATVSDATCQAALAKYGPAVQSACFGGATDMSFINSIKKASTVCSAACSQAVSDFQTNAMTPCASSFVLQGDDETNGVTFTSQLRISLAFTCTKDPSNTSAYCVTGELAAVAAAGINLDQPSAVADLTSFLASNPSVACSACLKNQLSNVSTLQNIDQASLSVYNMMAQYIAASCKSSASSTTTTGTTVTVKSDAQSLALSGAFLGVGLSMLC